jgi:hypothetical protein
MPISKLKPFNITLLHPAGFVHSLALKEAADYRSMQSVTMRRPAFKESERETG